MRAGKLKHRITIQKPTESVSSADGSFTNAFSALATVWAQVEGTGSREASQRAIAAMPEATHRVTIRYNASVTNKCRILWGTRVLDIAGPPIDFEGDERGQVIFCKEAK